MGNLGNHGSNNIYRNICVAGNNNKHGDQKITVNLSNNGNKHSYLGNRGNHGNISKNSRATHVRVVSVTFFCNFIQTKIFSTGFSKNPCTKFNKKFSAKAKLLQMVYAHKKSW